MRNTWTIRALFLGVGAALACTNNTSGGGGSAGSSSSSGGSGGGSGTETFSCTVASEELCTQLLIPSSGTTLSQEQSQCTSIQAGTSGTGCSTAGLVGCCLPLSTDESHEESCYYSAAMAQTGQTACVGGRTWFTTM